MVLIVHHLNVSQSERIPWLCEELGLTYELKTYKRSPVLAPPEYKALHPSGTAPIIQDGDVTLAESIACMEYISRKHANGRLFLDSAHPAFADFLYWFYWASGTFQPLLHRSMMSRGAGLTADSSLTVAYDQRRFAKSLEMLDERLRNNEWLAGSEFSAADVMIVFSLTTMRYFFPFSLKEHENVLKYLERVSKREAYQTAMKKCDPDMKLVLGADSPKPFGS